MMLEPTVEDIKYGWSINHQTLLEIKQRCEKLQTEFVPAEEYIEAILLALIDMGYHFPGAGKMVRSDFENDSPEGGQSDERC